MGIFARIKTAFVGLARPGDRHPDKNQIPGGATDNRSLGRSGESVAARYLKHNGYRIVSTNYRAKTGEIDIVAEEGGALVFVEVKMRRQSAYGSPQAAVDKRKQRKIARTAQHYLATTRQTGRRSRFDVLAITVMDGKTSFKIIKNAFESFFR